MQSEKLPAAQLIWTNSKGSFSTRLDILNARRLKDAGYDLRDAQRLGDLFADPYDAIDFFGAYLRPQWEEAGLAEVDFLELAVETEDSLLRLSDAITAGLLDFFLRCRDERRARIVEKGREAVKQFNAKLLERINSPKVDQALQLNIDNALADIDAKLDAAISGATSTDSSESSESTPPDSPSAS